MGSQIKKLAKIVVIDKDESIGNKIDSVFKNWEGSETQIRWFSSLVIDEIKDAYCVIIDIRLIKDPKNVIEILKALSVKKIIITTNEFNHPFSNTALSMGASVYFRNSPITSLIGKIFDINASTKDKLESSLKENSNAGKVFVFTSPKGGVGTTSLAINTAINFSIKKQKVLLIDFSTNGSIALRFKLPHNDIGLSGILDSLKSSGNSFSSLTSLVQQNIHTFTDDSNSNFDILISSNLNNISTLEKSTMKILLQTILSLEYDIIIIDLCSTIIPAQRLILNLCDIIVLVASPDITCTWNLMQFNEYLLNQNLGYKCVIALNRFSEKYAFSFTELEKELTYKIITIIPEYKYIINLENSAKFISQQQQHEMTVFYKNIANNLIPIFNKDELKMDSSSSFDILNIFRELKEIFIKKK